MRIAVVGSGVSGLAATWALNEFSEHEVHLYESDSRPGGHANTVEFKNKATGATVDVDTGFIVFNPTTYPNFLRFLKSKSDVRILPTEMTFSVSRDGGFFEWAGNNLMTVFCQPLRLLDPNMWRLIYDVTRFNACARKLILDDRADDISIGEYLEREGYSDSFRDNYLIPMTAAIWSTPPDLCATDFPARPLLRFMHNHHLLQITGKPSWLTIQGGSIKYVNSILSNLPKEYLHLSTPIVSASTTRQDEGKTKVRIKTAAGDELLYDHVIFACHSDTTLSILRAGGDITEAEEIVLGRVQWNKNEAILHSDPALMPRSRLAWSCWNYLTSSVVDKLGRVKANVDQISLTCNCHFPAVHPRFLSFNAEFADSMNILQHISEEKYGPVLVTLNAPHPGPREHTIVGRYQYDHPVVSPELMRSQAEIPAIQDKRGISFAGAWLGYGFHEDGFTSGLQAAVALGGVELPFDIRDPDREVEEAWIAPAFEFLEASGLRWFWGNVAAGWLWIGGLWLGIFFDTSRLETNKKA